MSRVPMEKEIDDSDDRDLKSVDEIASDSIRGVDEPMEKERPESPAMLVFATYPLLLIAGILLVLAVLWWWQWN